MLTDTTLWDERVTRREVVRGVGASFISTTFIARRAAAQPPPLPSPPQNPAADAILLGPSDPQFAQYQPAFNLRTALTPQLRAMCKTASGVSTMIDWCRSNGLPFAISLRWTLLLFPVSTPETD